MRYTKIMQSTVDDMGYDELVVVVLIYKVCTALQIHTEMVGKDSYRETDTI